MRIIIGVIKPLTKIHQIKTHQNKRLASIVGVNNVPRPFRIGNRAVNSVELTNFKNTFTPYTARNPVYPPLSERNSGMAANVDTASSAEKYTPMPTSIKTLDQANQLIDKQFNAVNLVETCLKDTTRAYQALDSWFSYVHSINKDSFGEHVNLLGGIVEKKYIGHLGKGTKSKCDYEENITYKTRAGFLTLTIKTQTYYPPLQ